MANGEHPVEPQGRRFGAKGIAIVVVIVLALVFVLQNTDETRVRFLMFDSRTGTWLALVIAFALGLLLGWLLPRLRDREG
jgi:uncharacterized integral membrane protein